MPHTWPRAHAAQPGIDLQEMFVEGKLFGYTCSPEFSCYYVHHSGTRNKVWGGKLGDSKQGQNDRRVDLVFIGRAGCSSLGQPEAQLPVVSSSDVLPVRPELLLEAMWAREQGTQTQ